MDHPSPQLKAVLGWLEATDRCDPAGTLSFCTSDYVHEFLPRSTGFRLNAKEYKEHCDKYALTNPSTGYNVCHPLYPLDPGIGAQAVPNRQPYLTSWRPRTGLLFTLVYIPLHHLSLLLISRHSTRPIPCLSLPMPSSKLITQVIPSRSFLVVPAIKVNSW